MSAELNGPAPGWVSVLTADLPTILTAAALGLVVIGAVLWRSSAYSGPWHDD